MIPIEGRPILSGTQMRAAELASGVDPYTLMERAGQGVAQATARLAAGAEVLVLCGPGNNGGDGYVAAAALRRAGLPVRVAAAGAPTADLARRARSGWTGPIEPLAEAAPAPVLLDALFGTGLSRPLDDLATHALQVAARRARLVLAVDVPSGVRADDGALLSETPWFDVTFALGAPKPAHLLQPAAARCGAVRLLDIGVAATGAVSEVLDAPVLSPPSAEDHKYSRGMVAVVAGRMPGAAALAAEAAARAGAGYVMLLGSATDRVPHAIVRRRYDAAALSDARVGAVLVGPGLGRDAAGQDRLDTALASPKPLVIDGDALRLCTPARIAERADPTVLTPHAGEFAALFGDGSGSKIERTQVAARASDAVVVFKGADTVVAHPEQRSRVARQGSPWLSTAGSGDVLAGAIAAVLAHGGDAFQAACTGVWLHADAARRCGASFIADDLAHALTAARASL